MIAPLLARHELLDRLDVLRQEPDREGARLEVETLLLRYVGDPGITAAVAALSRSDAPDDAVQGLPREDPYVEWVMAIERIAVM